MLVDQNTINWEIHWDLMDDRTLEGADMIVVGCYVVAYFCIQIYYRCTKEKDFIIFLLHKSEYSLQLKRHAQNLVRLWSPT